MIKKPTIIFKESPIDKFKYTCSKIFLFFCVCFFVFGLYLNLTYSIAPVSGFSMYPTLNENFVYGQTESQDRVVLNYIKNYKKGDIIVAKKMFDSSEDYIYVIKRLIAVEGDRVEILPSGEIKINNTLLSEEYLQTPNKSASYTNLMNYKNSNPEYFEDNVLIIPKGYVFYLGDNRANSYDCSYYGPVSEKTVIAKVDFTIKSGENAFLSILQQLFN